MYRFLLIGLCLSGLSGCGSEEKETSKPESETKAQQEEKSETPSAQTAEPQPELPAADAKTMQFTVRELIDLAKKEGEYETKKKYEKVWVELTGEFYSMKVVKTPNGKGHRLQILLKGKFEEQVLVDYVSIFAKPGTEPWKKCSPGDQVTVRGVMNQEYGLSLIWCEVISEGDPMLITTAEELAKQYQSDAQGTIAKYNKKTVIISGNLLRYRTDDDPALSGYKPSLFLKGTDDVHIAVSVDQFTREMEKDLKPGDPLTMAGEFVVKNITTDESPFSTIGISLAQRLDVVMPTPPN